MGSRGETRRVGPGHHARGGRRRSRVGPVHHALGVKRRKRVGPGHHGPWRWEEKASGQVTMPVVVGGENRRAQESERARARGSAASVPLREDRSAYIYLSCNTERQ